MIGGRGAYCRKRENSPLGLLGAGKCAGWWDWYGATTTAGNVSVVPNRASNGDLAQGNSTFRPVASTLLGRRCSSSDGTDDTLVAVLTAGIPIASRHYGWFVGQFTAIPVSATSRYGMTADNSLAVLRFQLSGAVDTAAMSCSDGSDAITGPASDLNPHLWEAGHLSVTTAKFRRDGVAYNGAKTGASSVAETAIYVHGLKGLADGFEVAIKAANLIVSFQEPTAAQLLGMRDWIRRIHFGLSIS